MNLVEAIELHLPRGYSIRGELGAGATSLVYLACCGEQGERIVVKVMLPGTVTPDKTDRFLREMQVLKKLAHPRIVPILAPGEANGALFFTMPYIESETLRARLKSRGRLSVRDALLVTRDIGDALGHAHGRGVVHRDVKPENILLAADGAYLIDFGFADTPALMSRSDAAKDAHMVVGTVGYMSPEKVTGTRAEDWRTDYFSLGCVLYEMLAGQPPFPADAARSAMTRRTSAEPPEIRALHPEVPEDVAAIVRRSLATDPSARFPTAGFLRMAIDGALSRLDGAAGANGVTGAAGAGGTRTG